MNERDRALQRDLEARARLASDPVFQVKQRRTSNYQRPVYRLRADDDREWLEDRPAELPACTARDESPLLPSERRLLQALSYGMTAVMAAAACGWSYDAVKAEIVSARRKLGAKNATQAVANAIRQGVIE